MHRPLVCLTDVVRGEHQQKIMLATTRASSVLTASGHRYRLAHATPFFAEQGRDGSSVFCQGVEP